MTHRSSFHQRKHFRVIQKSTLHRTGPMRADDHFFIDNNNRSVRLNSSSSRLVAPSPSASAMNSASTSVLRQIVTLSLLRSTSELCGHRNTQKP
jgi:hypothetical protein